MHAGRAPATVDTYARIVAVRWFPGLRLGEMSDRPDWRHDARCRGVVGVNSFTESGRSTARAKAVCAGCDVALECLRCALADPSTSGICGGTSEEDRMRLRSLKLKAL
jgi:hypothetical protein